MMRVSIPIIIALCAVAWVGRGEVNLLSGETRGSESASPVGDSVGTAFVVAKVAQYARREGSVEALLTAVAMVKDLDITPFAVPGGNIGGAAEKVESDTLGFDALLSEAAAAAKGDALLEQLVARHKETATQELQFMGRSGGELHGLRESVGGHEEKSYELTFRGGELAEMAVVGSGASQLAVTVYDESGKEVADSQQVGDDCFVRWWPVWTGTFRIAVLNRGEALNNFMMFSN